MTARTRSFRDRLLGRVASMSGIAASSLDEGAAIADLGLSSIQAIELSGWLAEVSGLELPATLAFEYPTLEAVADHVEAELKREGRSLLALEGEWGRLG